jgi:hypothetical protein
MYEGLVAYFLGATIVSYLNLAWFTTTLPVHVFTLMGCKDLYTWEDWETHVQAELPYILATLLTCHVCLPLWIGLLLISWPATLIAGLPLWCIPAFSLSWPIFASIAVRRYEGS